VSMTGNMPGRSHAQIKIKICNFYSQACHRPVTSQRLDKSMIGVHSFVSHFEGTVYRTDRLQAKDNTGR
jgi:hypothetical protein